MFDQKYYEDKKNKLLQKGQQLQQDYLGSAFKFVNEINDINVELVKIGEWEKENIKEVKEKQPKAK